MEVLELPYDPAIPLLGIYLDIITNSKRYIHLMFIATLFTIAKMWTQPKCPLTDEQIKEMWYMYTMGYYSALENNGIISFATM